MHGMLHETSNVKYPVSGT